MSNTSCTRSQQILMQSVFPPSGCDALIYVKMCCSLTQLSCWQMVDCGNWFRSHSQSHSWHYIIATYCMQQRQGGYKASPAVRKDACVAGRPVQPFIQQFSTVLCEITHSYKYTWHFWMSKLTNTESFHWHGVIPGHLLVRSKLGCLPWSVPACDDDMLHPAQNSESGLS